MTDVGLVARSKLVRVNYDTRLVFSIDVTPKDNISFQRLEAILFQRPPSFLYEDRFAFSASCSELHNFAKESRFIEKFRNYNRARMFRKSEIRQPTLPTRA